MSQDRQPRFVLIDPSAIHTGGHHYEYAARILKIAAQDGYAPELWAHRTAQLPQDDFPVRTLFRNSFYANFSRPTASAILKRLKDQTALHDILQDLMQRVRKKISDRMLPFFLESRAGLDAGRAWHDARFGQYSPVYDTPQNKLKTGRLSYSFYFLFFKVIGVIKRTVKEPGFKEAAYVVLFLIALLLLPIVLVVGAVVALVMFLKMQRPAPERVMAADLAKGIRQNGPWRADDIVFIPTSFVAEIKALGLFLNGARRESLPQFHLLFRTNPFVSYEDSHRDQINDWLDFRQAFRWLDGRFPKTRIAYYTDTPQLAAQYNTLSDEDFTVLPIPVPWMPAAIAPRDKDAPLTILYIGDVRDEKGYQFYPYIVENLWNEYVVTNRVRFVLQSNFADNPAACRQAAVAQAALRGYPDHIVRHVPGPMGSDDYKTLIDSADIVLITYQPDHYMARSSGIFIEAMKAGKPVLMPSGTWMASELETDRQNRWRTALVEKQPAKTLSKGQWPPHKPVVLKGDAAGYVAAEFSFPPSSHTGFVELQMNVAGQDGVSTRVQIGVDGKAVAVIPVPYGQDVELAYQTQGVSMALDAASLYRVDEPWQGPLHYAAAIYSHQNAADMTNGLAELIENIDGYKRDAAEYADKRGPYFTPETLVRDLLAKAGA